MKFLCVYSYFKYFFLFLSSKLFTFVLTNNHELFEIIIYLLDELCVINKTEIIVLKFCQDKLSENHFESVD